MSEVRDLLISGSEEVVGRYRVLPAGAKSDQEREFYRSRLEQGQRLLDALGGGFKKGFPPKRSNGSGLGPDRWSVGLQSAILERPIDRIVRHAR